MVHLKFWGYEKKTIGRPELMNEATVLSDAIIYQSGNAASVPANTLWVEATWDDDSRDYEAEERELRNNRSLVYARLTSMVDHYDPKDGEPWNTEEWDSLTRRLNTLDRELSSHLAAKRDRERELEKLKRLTMKHIRIHVVHAGGREDLVVDQALDGGPSLQIRAGGILRFIRTEDGESSATWIMDFPIANVYKISR